MYNEKGEGFVHLHLNKIYLCISQVEYIVLMATPGGILLYSVSSIKKNWLDLRNCILGCHKQMDFLQNICKISSIIDVLFLTS